MKSAFAVLLLCSLHASVSIAQEEVAVVPEPKESAWGRIYLRNGLAPIQYFRDDFGGPMVPREVSFHFPEDRFGCDPLPESEQLELQAANRSEVIVVDRGECTFEHKARLADQMGAAVLVVVSPTDDVTAPVSAMEEDGDISIASVMIRRTAGDMLRAVAKQMPLYGRFIPMTCERKPYTCKPRFEVEEDYIESSPARSGSVLSIDEDIEDSNRLGSFLAATYGSVLPTMTSFILAAPLDGSQACVDATEDMTTQSQCTGQVVLVPAGEAGNCSELEKVSNAQRRGASVVLLMEPVNASVMTHPGVEVSWHAYNVTIPVLAVSSTTGERLASLMDSQGKAASLRFALSNGIADAWALVAEHASRSAWPKRLKRCSKTLAKLLMQIRGLGGDFEVEQALKNVFINVVGGSLKEWEKVAHPDEDAGEAQESPDGTSQGKIVQTVKKSEVRDEL